MAAPVQHNVSAQQGFGWKGRLTYLIAIVGGVFIAIAAEHFGGTSSHDRRTACYIVGPALSLSGVYAAGHDEAIEKLWYSCQSYISR